jgi:hypothetical protein
MHLVVLPPLLLLLLPSIVPLQQQQQFTNLDLVYLVVEDEIICDSNDDFKIKRKMIYQQLSISISAVVPIGTTTTSSWSTPTAHNCCDKRKMCQWQQPQTNDEMIMSDEVSFFDQ